MEKRTLLKGWSLNRMADVCYVNPPRKNLSSKDPNFLTSFIPMSALDNTTGSITQKISRPFSEVSKGYTYFEDGDILFAKITPCMQNGKSAIAENLTEGFGFGSTEFHILRSKPGVNKKWIYHFIRTQEYRKKAQDHFEGSAGQQRVSGAFIENSLIPFPPTPEDQSTIANELESKMAEVEKMRQAALRQKEAVEVHREALLRRYFPYKEGDPLPKGWQWYELGDILKFKNGINFSSSEVGQGTLTLDVYNMYTETLQPQLNNLYRVNKNISDEYLLKEDDILFVRSSVKREGVGWPTVFKGYEEPVSFCGFIIRGRLVRDDIIPQYLVLYSRMASVREKFISASGQTTITNISQDNLRRVRVPIPSKKQEQNVIVEKIENKFIKMEKMQQSSEKQLEAIQALPAAILREVFDFQEANA